MKHLDTDPAEIERLAGVLVSLMDWSLSPDGTAIGRTLEFADFASAFGFMTEVALAAGGAGHALSWSNSEGRVEISLTTQGAGVTERDVALARAINLIAARRGRCRPPDGAEGEELDR